MAHTAFSVAVNESWKDKTTGEKKEHVEWVQCTTFGKLAEIAGQYVTVGMSLYVQGKFRTEKYTANDGAVKYATKIIVDQLQMLGGKSEASEPKAEKVKPDDLGKGSFDEGVGDEIPF